MRTLIRSRRVALPLAALALAGSGMAAYGATTGDEVNYRTVAASRGDVDQVLALTGVVESTGRSDLAFGTDGTVARVPVDQGDTVRKGDVIAALDRSDLRAAVDKAKSDLAAAKVQLADDRDAQTSAVETASTAANTDTAAAPARQSSTPAQPKASETAKPSSSANSPVSPVLKELKAQQDAVIASQSAASAALATAATALTTQEQACAVADTPAAEPSDGPSDGATDGATDGSSGGDTGLSDACTAALAAVQSAQSATATAQSALQTALEKLGGTLTTALGALQTEDQAAPEQPAQEDTPAAETPSEPPSAQVSTPSGSSDSASSAGPAARTVTAATLAADQTNIDRAAAALASAKVAYRAGVVRAPADGTVVSLAVATGDDVASGDAVAVVVAPGLTAVSLEVTAAQAAQLKPGTAVEVTPAGATAALKGSISRVENVPASDASDGADPTYPVEVVLDERDLGLPDGIPASVAVVVGSADGVVTVPASAIVNGTVTVLAAGKAQRVRVTTGIVGSTEVEILDGVKDGDEVVLADIDADLPSAETADEGPQRIQFGGGGGGFSGGGPPSGPMPGR